MKLTLFVISVQKMLVQSLLLVIFEVIKLNLTFSEVSLKVFKGF
jgi:hypothetical protein